MKKNFTLKESNLIKKKARVAASKFKNYGIDQDDIEQEVWAYLCLDRIYLKVMEYRGEENNNDYLYPDGGYKKLNTTIDRCIYTYINAIIKPHRPTPLYTVEELARILPYVFEDFHPSEVGNKIHDTIIVVKDSFYKLNWKDRQILQGRFRDNLNYIQFRELVPAFKKLNGKEIEQKITNCLIHLQNYIGGDDLSLTWNEKEDKSFNDFNNDMMSEDYYE